MANSTTASCELFCIDLSGLIRMESTKVVGEMFNTRNESNVNPALHP